MFHISIIAPNATMVIYGIVFGGIQPTGVGVWNYCHFCLAFTHLDADKIAEVYFIDSSNHSFVQAISWSKEGW